MQKKVKTYLLLVLVIGIWGTVAYKIISGLQTDVPEVLPTDTYQVQFAPKTPVSVETFTIKTVDRDPFLGRITNYHTTKDSATLTSNTQAPKMPVVWPQIMYMGALQTNEAKPIYIVAMNGQQFLLKKGQELQEVKLLKTYKDSIIMLYRGEKKAFTKL